jgi:F1F0 ATPase subunit 2
MSLPAITLAVIWLALGAALGALYFVLLYRMVQRFAAGAPATRTLPLLALRGALAIGLFWIMAQQGAVALLAGLVGFVAARYVLQRLLGFA